MPSHRNKQKVTVSAQWRAISNYAFPCTLERVRVAQAYVALDLASPNRNHQFAVVMSAEDASEMLQQLMMADVRASSSIVPGKEIQQ